MNGPERKSSTEALDVRKKADDMWSGKRPVDAAYPYIPPDYQVPFLHIGTERQLFVDNFILDHLDGVEREIVTPIKAQEPLLTWTNLPWEQVQWNPGLSGVVHDPDDGKFKSKHYFSRPLFEPNRWHHAQIDFDGLKRAVHVDGQELTRFEALKQGEMLGFRGGPETALIDNVVIYPVESPTKVNDRNITAIDYVLHDNFPNPFNSQTTINYQTAQPGNVKIVVYDLLGKSIATLADRRHNAGPHRVVWNGKDKFGDNAPSGMYIVRMEANDVLKSRKILLLK